MLNIKISSVFFLLSECTLNAVMANNIMYEVSRRVMPLNGVSEVSMSWYDYILAASTPKCVSIFELSHNLECLDKRVEVVEFTVLPPASGPTKQLCSSSKKTDKLIRKQECGKGKISKSVDASVCDSVWSPSGILPNNQSALAVLNSYNDVHLYCVQSHQWKIALSLSKSIKSYHKAKKLDGYDTNTKSLNVNSVCWASHLNDDNSCYLVTAQQNSHLLFWKIHCEGNNFVEEIQADIEDNYNDIKSMLWIRLSEKDFILVITTLTGQIIANNYSFTNNDMQLDQSNILYGEKDFVPAMYLQYLLVDNGVLLFSGKCNRLVVLMFDVKLNLLAQNEAYYFNSEITTITKFNNNMYFSTKDCNIYKVDFKISSNNLDIKLNSFDIKLDVASPNDRLLSFSFSNNGLLGAMAIISEKICHRKEALKIEIVYFCMDLQFNSVMDHLLNNPTQKLTHVWDCIELLRYKTLKAKSLPAIDYNSLYKDSENDLYKLRLYLILLKLYHNLYKLFKIDFKGILPETSEEFVKEKILVSHAINILRNLYNTHKNIDNMSGLDRDTFVGAKNFIDYYCKKYNTNLLQYDQTESFDFSYTCQCCDKTIKGFTCLNDHFNMMCSITFTQIESDYLICRSCNATARIDLLPLKPTINITKPKNTSKKWRAAGSRAHRDYSEKMLELAEKRFGIPRLTSVPTNIIKLKSSFFELANRRNYWFDIKNYTCVG